MSRNPLKYLHLLALATLLIVSSSGCALTPDWFSRSQPEPRYTGNAAVASSPMPSTFAAGPTYQSEGPSSVGMPEEGRYDADTINRYRNRSAAYGLSRGAACRT